MKNISVALLFALLVLTLNSCRKNDADNKPTKGQWRWSFSQGGFSGTSIRRPSPKSVVTLTLDSNLTFTTYLNNQTKVQGKYYIVTSSENISVIHLDQQVVTDIYR